MSSNHPTKALLACLLAFALVAAACSDDSSDPVEIADDDTAEDTAEDEEMTEDDEEMAEDEEEMAEDEEVAPEPEPEPEPEPDPGFEGDLVGLFSLDPTECATAGAESGSYFRMILPGGTTEDGPFIENADSICADLTYIPLLPGTDGGLLTGQYQPGEDPLFVDRNATAGRIAAPTVFFALTFGAASTDEADPPMILATDGALSGDLSAMSAYYNELIFNQGAPKADGSTPGITSAGPTGTIDPETGVYTLDWVSQVVDGAFNDFTGVWHFEGTFTPS